MVDKVKLARLLRAFAQIVESSTEDELKALERLSVSDILSAGGASKRPSAVKLRRSPKTSDFADFTRIIESIRYLPTREAGVSLIERENLDKRSLERIARHLDLPVLKEDSSMRLVQKIVEAILGSRLNSEAIRGGSNGR
jgi:hypothetical protein